MSAARTLAALAAAGGDLRVDGRQLVLVGPRTLPLVLRAEVRAAAPALLRVASGRWRLDLAAWPAWRREAFEERAALMADGGVAPELVEQLAYLDTAEQPEPPPDPEPPEGDLEVSSDDAPAGTPDLAGADLPAEPPLAGAPVPNVPTIAKEDGPPIAKVDSVEAPGAQLDGPEAPRADRLQRPQPPGYPLRAAAGVDLERPAPPLASPEAVARAIDGTLGGLPTVLAPWQRFELGAWGADRRDRWARGVAQARAEGAEEVAAEVLAYYRTRPGGPAAPGVDLEPVADRPVDPFEGPEHDQCDPFEGPATPPRRPPPAWRWSDVVPMAPQAPSSDRGAPPGRPAEPSNGARDPGGTWCSARSGPGGGATGGSGARCGLVILPSGAYVDAGQADELPRPPCAGPFRRSHRPRNGPRRAPWRAFWADVAADMADRPHRRLKTTPEHDQCATFAGPRCLVGRPEHGDARGHATLDAPPRGPDLPNRPLPTMQPCPGWRRSRGEASNVRGPGAGAR